MRGVTRVGWAKLERRITLPSETAIHPRWWTPGGCAPLDLANRAARIHKARTERIHVPDDDRADFAPLDALDPPLNSQGLKSNQLSS